MYTYFSLKQQQIVIQATNPGAPITSYTTVITA